MIFSHTSAYVDVWILSKIWLEVLMNETELWFEGWKLSHPLYTQINAKKYCCFKFKLFHFTICCFIFLLPNWFIKKLDELIRFFFSWRRERREKERGRYWCFKNFGTWLSVLKARNKDDWRFGSRVDLYIFTLEANMSYGQ